VKSVDILVISICLKDFKTGKKIPLYFIDKLLINSFTMFYIAR